MLETVLSKNELRKEAKNIRSKFLQSGYLNQISSRILFKILNSSDFKFATNVALYYPLEAEIDLRALMNVSGKNYFLPRCVGNSLEFVEYRGVDSLVKSQWGVMEPIGDKIDPKILDLIYIPALIANKRNFRLGYGKGYYDKFFYQNKLKAKKIIVVARKLISDKFREDEFDYKADEIICE